MNTLQRRLSPDKDLSEIPAAQHRPVAKALAYYARRCRNRNAAIVKAYASGAYGLKAIGAHFGLHVLIRESNREGGGEGK